MFKSLLINVVGKLTYRRVKKKFDKEPLYKPLAFEIDGMEIPEGLINSCHYLHKSMMFLLERQDKDLEGIEKIEAEKSRDYIAAIILQWYFTTWCQDVQKMHMLSEGNE